LNKWISVKDMLPEDTKKYYLTYNKNNLLKTRILQTDNWERVDNWLGITHWMYLPEPPGD